MAWAETYEALKEFVTDNIGSEYTVQYENQEGFEKPNDAAYVVYAVRNGSALTTGIGSAKLWRQPGVLTFKVVGPIGTDEEDINTIIDVIVDVLKYARIEVGDTENSVVRFNAVSINPIGRIEGRYQVNAEAQFFVDYSSATFAT